MSKQLSKEQFIQYYRQLMLPDVEESGQYRLLQQHILIVGAGGLGTHVAQQLAAAGIGQIHIMDNDTVEASNLPRQVLFGSSDIDKLKVEQVKKRLEQQNNDCRVFVYPQRFDASFNTVVQGSTSLGQAIQNNALTVLDCSDNMSTRQAVNQWCVRNKTRLISAAISAYTGHLLLIDTTHKASAGCYRCLFSESSEIQGCETMGVLGPAVGAVASMQSLLTINHLLRKPTTQAHSCLHLFDGQTLTWRQIKRQRDPACPVCSQV